MNPDGEDEFLTFGEKVRFLFSFSWIPGIPQIARSDSLMLRNIKILFYCFCLCGFLYQSLQMFLIYLNRPIVLTFEVEHPDSILVPAMTICPNVQLNKKKYCIDFPERCENKTVKDEYRKDEFHQTYEMMTKLGISWADIAFDENISWLNKPFSYAAKVVWMPFIDTYGRIQRCFVLNHQLLNVTDDPLMFPSNTKSLFKRVILIIRIISLIYDDLKMIPEVFPKMGVLHSPYLLKNPFKGYGDIILHQSAQFFVYKIREVHRLPPPFSTSCRDYPALWKKLKTGPVSRDICIGDCIFEKTWAACKCYALETMTYKMGRFCDESDVACLANIDAEACYNSCPLDCLSIEVDYYSVTRKAEFAYDILQRYLTIPTQKELSLANMSDLEDSFAPIIILDSNKKLITRYKPKYELIEVFSYIGGYLGIWLGISLAGVLDLFGILWKLYFN